MGSSFSKSSKAQKRIKKPKTHAKPAVNGGTIQDGFGKPYRDVSERITFRTFGAY